MKRLICPFIALLSLLLTASCSKKKHFTVSGELEGLGAQAVEMTWYAAGGIQRISAPAQEGRFSLRGAAPTPTLCVISMANAGDIATLVVRDGDKINLRGSINDPLAIKASGNSESEKISEWTSVNAQVIRAGDARLLNRSIASFVSDNRKSLASAALLVTRFQTPGYELLADSLMTLIDPAARPVSLMQNFNSLLADQLMRHESGEVRSMLLWGRNDSVYRYNPIAHSLSVIAFRAPGTPTDSMATLLRDLSATYPERRLAVIEISTARDSASWKQSTARDSAAWHQTWAPGSVAAPEVERLKVPRIPFVIIADSMGQQIYRGSSTAAVRNLLDSRLGRFVKTVNP